MTEEQGNKIIDLLEQISMLLVDINLNTGSHTQLEAAIERNAEKICETIYAAAPQ